MADLSTQIETAAQSPANATVDGRAVSAVPVPDQIAADRYLKGSAAVKKRNRGLSITQMIHPGHVNTSCNDPPGW